MGFFKRICKIICKSEIQKSYESGYERGFNFGFEIGELAVLMEKAVNDTSYIPEAGIWCLIQKKEEREMAKDDKWIQGAIKKPGALRKELKVKKGEKIPEKKLDKAAKSTNPTLAKRARLAKTLKGFNK